MRMPAICACILQLKYMHVRVRVYASIYAGLSVSCSDRTNTRDHIPRRQSICRAARMRRIAGAAVEEVTRMRAAAASADRGLRDSLIRHHVRVLSGGGVREAQQLQIGAATPGSRKSWYA